ncbi:MAG: hypothetical protein L0I76_00905 [Pseudonocardia sp.]|nr:hypothetical protein [Pseudonocardia sp.]
MARSPATTWRIGLAGGPLMAVTFGMVRYAYGLTLPAIRTDLVLSDLVLGLIASGTFLGFLVALLLSTPLSAKAGPRASTTLGGLVWPVAGPAASSSVCAPPRSQPSR